MTRAGPLREPPWKGTWLGAMLLVVLSLLFFVPFLTNDAILFPLHTAVLPPWSDETPKKTVKELEDRSNRLMTDKFYVFHPELLVSKEALGNGRLPLWDPYSLGGIPHLAQGLPGLFNVAGAAYLIFDPAKAYAISGLVQVILAGLFMLLFLRALEIRHFAAFLGGISFAFSGWMLFHLHYFMICSAALWLPLLLLGAEKLMRGAKLWWIFALALGSFQTLCAGFPQIAVMNLYFTTAYALVRAGFMARENRTTALRRLALSGLGLFLGILLSGIQLLPLVEVGHSHDSTRNPAPLEVIREMTLEPACLLTFLSPDLFGHPDLSQQMESPYLMRSSLVAMASLPQRPDINYLEIQGYVGVLPFILALLVFLAKSRKGWRFFAISGALSIALAMGLPGLLDLTALLPGLMIGDAKRFLFLVAFCFSVLAAFTLDACWKPGGAPLRVHWTGLGLLGLLILIVFAAWIGLTISSETAVMEAACAAIENKTGIAQAEIESHISPSDLEAQRNHLSSTLLKTLLNLVLAALVLLLSTGWTRDWTVSRPIIVAVLVVDLFAVGWRFNQPMNDLELFDPENPVVQFLIDETGPQRIIRYGQDNLYPVNAGSIHKIRDAQGYTAFYSRRYQQLIDLVEPGLTNSYGIRRVTLKDSLSSRVLDLIGVKYILSQEELPLTGLQHAFTRKSVHIYENIDFLPRAFLQTRAFFVSNQEEAAARIKKSNFDPRRETIIEDPSRLPGASQPGEIRDVRIVQDQEESVTIQVEGGPGWLVLSDAYAAGWTASLDGMPVPILPANLAFRAVEIPDADPHTVTFLYRPEPVRHGAIVSLVGICLCLAVLAAIIIGGRRRRRRALDPVESSRD